MVWEGLPFYRLMGDLCVTFISYKPITKFILNFQVIQLEQMLIINVNTFKTFKTCLNYYYHRIISAQLIVMFGLRTFTIRQLTNKIYFRFSNNADPYYILGVEKGTPFPQIKKAFYKLASEFHPDKNNSQQAQKNFVVIKQAFESIKMEKGLMKPQNFYSSEQRESMRPNPEKYATESSESDKNFTDYTVFSQKAETNQEYMSFNTSFKTIKDINNIKIKVEEGVMPDPTDRFKLSKYTAKISSYNETGMKYFFVMMTGLMIFLVVANYSFSQKEIETKEGALKKLTQIQKRKTIAADLVENRKIDVRNIEQSKEIVEFKNKEITRFIKEGKPVSLVDDKVISLSKVESV